MSRRQPEPVPPAVLAAIAEALNAMDAAMASLVRATLLLSAHAGERKR